MSSDDPTEYSSSSKDSVTPPSQPAPKRQRDLLSTYMTTFGHLILLYRGAIDIWVFKAWSKLVAPSSKEKKSPKVTGYG